MGAPRRARLSSPSRNFLPVRRGPDCGTHTHGTVTCRVPEEAPGPAQSRHFPEGLVQLPWEDENLIPA